MNPKIDNYLDRNEKWQKELTQLRAIILDCNLTEELKWGVPCYTFQDTNVVLIHAFKEYCAILFMKGVLINDVNGVLVQQTENVQAARQMRFTSVKEIGELKSVIKTYVHEAIEIEKSGQKVKMIKSTELVFPEEFQKQLDKKPALRTAFEALTPGRQRAYNLYFSAAKQAKTREERVQKYIPKILDGKGLDD